LRKTFLLFLSTFIGSGCVKECHRIRAYFKTFPNRTYKNLIQSTDPMTEFDEVFPLSFFIFSFPASARLTSLQGWQASETWKLLLFGAFPRTGCCLSSSIRRRSTERSTELTPKSHAEA
jgi:hypothetical protein